MGPTTPNKMYKMNIIIEAEKKLYPIICGISSLFISFSSIPTRFIHIFPNRGPYQRKPIIIYKIAETIVGRNRVAITKYYNMCRKVGTKRPRTFARGLTFGVPFALENERKFEKFSLHHPPGMMVAKLCFALHLLR